MLRYRRHGIARTLRAVWKRRAFAYGAALCSVIAATLLALPLYPDDADFPALLLLAAVGVSAALGGFGPAIIATIGGFVSLDYFFEYPPYSLTIQALGTSLDLHRQTVRRVLEEIVERNEAADGRDDGGPEATQGCADADGCQEQQRWKVGVVRVERESEECRGDHAAKGCAVRERAALPHSAECTSDAVTSIPEHLRLMQVRATPRHAATAFNGSWNRLSMRQTVKGIRAGATCIAR